MDVIAVNTSAQLKLAAIGGDQETGFEQSFASLAHAYLKDQAPKLVESVVGFQLVDRNEDNTKAVGVFGFQLGEQWLYAPVFFLNGDLKGHELLYIKKQDRFVPLKENWVNYLMSRRPHVLGETSRDTRELGGAVPNIERLSWPPTQNKFSEWKIEHWADDFMSMAAAAAAGNVRFMHRKQASAIVDIEKVAAAPIQYAFLGQSTSLEDFLQGSSALFPALEGICHRYPGIKQAVAKFYDPNKLRAAHRIAVEKEAQNRAAQALSIMPKAVKTEYRYNSPTRLFKSVVEKRAAGPKIEISTSDDVAIKNNVTVGMNEEDRAKLLSDGYLVKDHRAGDEISIAYNTQKELTLTNPDSSGLYDMLESPGNFGRMLVIASPYTNAGRRNFLTICRPEGGKRSWLNADRTAVWHRGKESDDDFRTWWEGLDSGSNLVEDGTYVAISVCGKGTTAFRVNKSMDEAGCYKVNFNDNEDYKFRRPEGLPALERRKSDGHYISTYDATLHINEREGSTITTLGEEIYIPDNFKFVKLQNPRKPLMRVTEMSFCCGGSDELEDEDKPIKPGRLEDVQALFTEKTSMLKLIGDNNEVTIATEKTGFHRTSWTRGLFNLIRQHGLSEKQAEEMLKTAQRHGEAKYRVKYAYGFPETAGPGPSAPGFPQPGMGSMQVGYGQQLAQFPQEEHNPVDGLQAGRTDPSVYDPWAKSHDKAMQTAQLAAQQGQKEVFDTAMIGSMLKAVRQDSLVDKYLGDLMQALDRLGRILFMFYWHQDEFEDRYGKSDMPELEDSIRNSFETLGDLVLFLREQQAGPDMNFDGPDIEDITGD